MHYETEIQASIKYLRSRQAFESLAADPYWPKWNSPWWHMLLLHEMGETRRIPEACVAEHVKALNRLPVKIFPIREHLPSGIDPFRDVPCHCQLGNVYQVLDAWGLDVDQELPWIRPWFLRCQMSDGGMNCDSGAYLVKDEVPSSMVGLISVFEAVLLHTRRPWTAQERTFLEKGARFLINRKLMLGSRTKHNYEEHKDAGEWLQLCFPRFYFYDVLRGLNALTLWAEKTGSVLPPDSIETVVSILKNKSQEGVLKNERLCFEGVMTFKKMPAGDWLKGQSADLFPLLNRVSAIGEVSPFLTRGWEAIRSRLGRPLAT